MMELEEFEDDLDELESAEDFLNYFEIPFEQKVVHVNRLHILQRFHNYLKAAAMPEGVEGRRAIYSGALGQAYQDFINSNAQTEKVLRVYQKASGTSFFSLDRLGGSAG
jgi:nitrogenase-stabilizing/protective protein